MITEASSTLIRGSDPIHLRGTGFSPSAEVFLGGFPAKVEVRSSSEISAYLAGPLSVKTAPAPGPISLVVRNPDGREAKREDLRYVAKEIRFAAPLLLPAPGGPQHLALGDLNGDQQTDVVVSCFRDHVLRVFLHHGSAGLMKSFDVKTGKSPLGVVLADFNGDKKLDAAIASSEERAVHIHLGLGDGNFAPASAIAETFDSTALPSRPHLLAAASLVGGGAIDLVSSNFDVAGVFENRGDGSFLPQKSIGPTGGFPMGVALGDVNEDGRPDLFLSNADKLHLSYYLSEGGGGISFGARNDLSIAGLSYDVLLRDLNSDRRLDLLVPSERDGTLAVFLGLGGGRFQPRADFPAGRSPKFATSADLDGDGDDDIALSSPVTASVRILPGRGDGTFGETVNLSLLGAAVEGLLAGPIGRGSGTDQLALVGAGYSSDQLVILQNISR